MSPIIHICKDYFSLSWKCSLSTKNPSPDLFLTLPALQISLKCDPHLLLHFSSSQPFLNPQQSDNSKIPMKVISDLLVPKFSWLLWDLSPWTFPPRASLRSSLMSLILPHCSFCGNPRPLSGSYIWPLLVGKSFGTLLLVKNTVWHTSQWILSPHWVISLSWELLPRR